MKEFSKREKVIAVIVAITVIGFLVNQFLLEPQSRKLRELRKELTTLSERTAGIGPKLVEFNTLSANLASKKKQLAELEQVLSHEAEVAEMLHEVSSQARTQGLKIQHLRPQRTTVMLNRTGKRGKYRKLVVDLGVRGRYEQLGNFLGALEQQPFYVKVAEVRMERGGAPPPLIQIQLKLELIVRS